MVKFAENQWKRAFFALLGGVFILGAGLACGLLMWINSLSSALDPDDWPPLGEKHEEASAVFTLSVTKKDLNTFIRAYLRQDAEGNADYDLYLDDRIHFRADIPVFNRHIPLVMSFDPLVLQTGDVLLELRTMHLGSLQLPPELVVALIKGSYTFPEWVMINPERAEIYLALTRLKIQDQFYLKVQTFDLERDEIVFQLIYDAFAPE